MRSLNPIAAAMAGLLTSVGLASVVLAEAPVMDGALDAAYGADADAVQDTQTQFGDSNIGLIEFANGSEIDACWAVIDGDTLYLLFTGNIESNWNKLDIFLDYQDGGQNQLRGDNADIDLNGLNRMGDDGSGNGLRFDGGFAPDYYVTATCGDSAPFRFEVRYAELLTKGGGTGDLAGVVNGGGGANVIVGLNGIMAALDNSNVSGVLGGCEPMDGSGAVTGVEIALPLALLGNPTGDIRICALINGTFHDFVSNQVLGGVAGMCNLGEPRTLDFGIVGGDQFFTVEGSGGGGGGCPADVDNDNNVGFADLVELLANWGPCPGCPTDIDGSGDVGFADLVELLANWGPCP